MILAASSLVNADTDKLIVASASSRMGVPLLSETHGGMHDNPDAFLMNGGLKLRVVWTISSLVAASACHYLLQEIICDHLTLDSLVLADTDAQGTLSMNKEQLSEFQGKPLAASASTNRTQVPPLNMKLWYAPLLDLPGGPAMKGATLVLVCPSGLSMKEGMESFSTNAFEEPFRKAAGLLVKRRTYLLEMNSF